MFLMSAFTQTFYYNIHQWFTGNTFCFGNSLSFLPRGVDVRKQKRMGRGFCVTSQLNFHLRITEFQREEPLGAVHLLCHPQTQWSWNKENIFLRISSTVAYNRKGIWCQIRAKMFALPLACMTLDKLLISPILSFLILKSGQWSLSH